jgi:hypothetical protein
MWNQHAIKYQSNCWHVHALNEIQREQEYQWFKKKKNWKKMRLKGQKGNGIMLTIGKCEDDKHNIFFKFIFNINILK